MISPQFIQSCQSGDESAIQNLVQTYQRAVFQLALSIIDFTGSSDEDASTASASATFEAEMATRDTFVAAVDRIGRYREDSNFETWLFGIAIQISQRRAHNWRVRRASAKLLHGMLRAVSQRAPKLLKSAQNPGAVQNEAVQPQPASGTPAEKSRLQPGDAELWASVRRLDEKLRVPVVLRYYHDYPIEQIAHLLHISEGTVHARLDAAREKITLHIEK
jgi:RNA polymerase sigma factor (sigma-70 family)